MFKSIVPYLVLAALCAGCAAPAQFGRASIEGVKEIKIVHVVTPAIEARTMLQQYVASPIGGGFVPAAIAENQAKKTLEPSVDLSRLVGEKLSRRLGEMVTWWPPAAELPGARPANYVYPDGVWLRIQVLKAYITPTPINKLYVQTIASLRRPADQGPPLWELFSIYYGALNGGEQLTDDALRADPSLLTREVTHAADITVQRLLNHLVLQP